MSEQTNKKYKKKVVSIVFPLLSHLYTCTHTYTYIHSYSPILVSLLYSFILEVSVALLNFPSRGFAQFVSRGQIFQMHRLFTQILASATSWSCSL